MISQIEALNYRCLKYIRQPVGNFHVLIGPNASGKTTFLDVVSFLGRLVADGVEQPLPNAPRTSSIYSGTETAAGSSWRLRTVCPDVVRGALPFPEATEAIRYEVTIGIVPDSPTEEVGILNERVFLKSAATPNEELRSLFPEPIESPASITHRSIKGTQLIISKNYGGNDTFKPEIIHAGKKNWVHSFKLGSRKSALGNLPPDATQFPATTWLQDLLADQDPTVYLEQLADPTPKPTEPASGISDRRGQPAPCRRGTGVASSGAIPGLDRPPANCPDRSQDDPRGCSSRGPASVSGTGI